MKNSLKTGAECISDFISRYCFSKVFVVTGGACAFIIDAVHRNPKIDYVVMQHEQSSAMAADAIWRVTRKIGVTVSTSGPGATNLITGIACSWFDSIPSIHITGQVNQNESKEKLNSSARQVGFQETDIVSMVSTITKYAVKVDSTTALLDALLQAFKESQSDRFGPCLIDVPIDVQKADVKENEWRDFELKINEFINLHSRSVLFDKNINQKIHNFLSEATKPCVVIGAGLGLSEKMDEALTYLNNNNIPYVSSWNALSYIRKGQYSNYLGSIGVYGSKFANKVVDRSDRVLVLGSRLDNRQRSADPDLFAPRAKKMVIDVDLGEIQKYSNSPEYECLNIDLKKINFDELEKIQISNGWTAQIEEIKQSTIDGRSSSVAFGEMSPYEVTDWIFKYSNKDSIIISDTGANLCWVYQSFIPFEGLLFTAGGNSPMGYSLPAAIGSYFADPEREIICIIGDGGLQMNLQELQTISNYDIPIKIVILNNNGYGIIKQFQDSYFNSRYAASGEGYSSPNFKKIADAYDLEYIEITKVTQLKNEVFEELNGPLIIDVKIPDNALITPKLEMGHGFSDQFPYNSIS